MKLIISILLFPSLVAVILAWGCYSFYRYGITDPLASGVTSQAHVFKAFLYMAVGLGIPLSVSCFLTGVATTLLSFIFKNWTRAAISIAIASSGMYIWLYLLNAPWPA